MPQNSNIKTTDIDELSRIMQIARQHDSRFAQEYKEREAEIDELENEIIKNYANNKDLKLNAMADPITCQKIFAETANILSRITEIYTSSIRLLTKFKTVRNTLMDGLLPLLQGGSADTREAKARGCAESLNRLIANEEGLIEICEATQRNVKAIQDMASRQLKAIELDIVYFSGSDSIKAMMDANKNQNLKERMTSEFTFDKE